MKVVIQTFWGKSETKESTSSNADHLHLGVDSISTDLVRHHAILLWIDLAYSFQWPLLDFLYCTDYSVHRLFGNKKEEVKSQTYFVF